MKKIIPLTIMAAIIALALPVTSQEHHGQKAERIKALKTAFITEKLALTPKEAEKFWPVYNDLEERERELHRSMSRSFANGKPDISGMSDEELEELIEGKFNKELALLELRLEYYEKFKEILPVSKIFRLYEAEMQFRKVLLQRLKEERPERGKM